MFRKPFVDDDCNDSSVCTRAPSPPAVLAELNNITAPPPKRVRMEDSDAAAASPISDQQSQMLPPPTVDTAQQPTKGRHWLTRHIASLILLALQYGAALNAAVCYISVIVRKELVNTSYCLPIQPTADMLHVIDFVCYLC